jgi:O-acetyl-ADP-ribose deacetylase (regulator of RNase III)
MNADNREDYKDLNTCMCSKCYDIHKTHDRVPTKNGFKFIVGDLVKDAEQYEVILHGCNCFNTMGAGIALQVKNKYPQAYAVDCTTKSGDKAKLGTISYTTDTIPIIVNCYSQYDFRGRRVGKMDLDYNALKSALTAVKKEFSGKKIGMPRIGAQLAGGDWNVIIRIIEEVFQGEDVTIVTWIGDVGKF